MEREVITVGEIVSDTIFATVSARVEGSSGSTQVVELPAAIQFVTEAYQAGMNYAFETVKDLQLTSCEE